jgi:hypothetical protein
MDLYPVALPTTLNVCPRSCMYFHSLNQEEKGSGWVELVERKEVPEGKLASVLSEIVGKFPEFNLETDEGVNAAAKVIAARVGEVAEENVHTEFHSSDGRYSSEDRPLENDSQA